MATVGKQGYVDVANQCLQKAHYAADQLVAGGLELAFKAPFFQEFAVKLPGSISETNKKLFAQNIIGGLDLGQFYPELANTMLVAVTENRTKAEIDKLVLGLEGK